MKPVRQSARTAVGLAALAAIVMLVVGTVLWQTVDSRRSLRNQVLATSRNTAEVAGIAVAQDLKAQLQLLEQASRVPAIAEVIEKEDRNIAVLLSAIGQAGGFAAVTLVSPDGTVVAAQPPETAAAGSPVEDHELFASALDSPDAHLSNAFAIREGDIGVRIAATVRNGDGQPLGVMVAVLSTDHIARLTNQLKLPTEGTLRLIDAAGHPLWKGADPAVSYWHDPIVAQALKGRSGGAEGRVLGLPGNRLVAYAPIAGSRWAVIIEQPVGAAYQPVTALTFRLSLIGGLVGLGALGAALFLTRLLRHLARERNQSNAILTSIADGAVMTGPEGVILAINPAMESLLGWRQDDVRGLRYRDVFKQCDHQSNLVGGPTILDEAIATRTGVASRGYDVNMARRSGELVPVSVTAAPVLDNRGDLLGGVAIVRDVSYEREVDQMKSSLVSTVSHELRTPLTMIQGFSELLLARDVPEQQRRDALMHINVSAERLARLIEDVLSVSRIESGRLAPQLEALSVEDVVEEVLVPLAQTRLVNMDIARGAEVLSDRDMVIQVLTNLVSNALKYSPSDSPIDVSVTRVGSSLAFTVRDHGIGMTEDEVGRLFEKFFRADRAEVRDAGGTGLGLYITRSLVELLSGTIAVDSSIGEGSAFTFTLPALVQQPEGVPA